MELKTSRKTYTAEVIAKLQAWLKQHPDSTHWLVLGHGHAHTRSPRDMIPAGLADKAAFFLLDHNPKAKPDVVLDMTNDLYILPDAIFGGILLASLPTFLVTQHDVLLQLQRIVKPKGYWVNFPAYVANQKGALDQLMISFTDQRDNLVVPDHFTVPYKLKYQLPPECYDLFFRYFDLIHRSTKDLPDTEHKQSPEDRERQNLELFKSMFGMTPEELATSGDTSAIATIPLTELILDHFS